VDRFSTVLFNKLGDQRFITQLLGFDNIIEGQYAENYLEEGYWSWKIIILRETLFVHSFIFSITRTIDSFTTPSFIVIA